MDYKKAIEDANRQLIEALHHAWMVGMREAEIGTLVDETLYNLHYSTNAQIVPIYSTTSKTPGENFLAYNTRTDEWFEVRELDLVRIKAEMKSSGGWVFLPLMAFGNDVMAAVEQLGRESVIIRNAEQRFNNKNDQ